jgi:hypothetical protein
LHAIERPSQDSHHKTSRRSLLRQLMGIADVVARKDSYGYVAAPSLRLTRTAPWLSAQNYSCPLHWQPSAVARSVKITMLPVWGDGSNLSAGIDKRLTVGDVQQRSAVSSVAHLPMSYGQLV